MAERSYTDLELERFLAGDLPAARAAELEAKASTADRTRLEELRADNAAFLAETDVGAEVRAIGKQLGKLEPERTGRATWWRWVFGGGMLAAAAAVLLVMVLRRSEGPKVVDEGDDLLLKGGHVTLAIHVATGDTSKRLASGDLVAPGARIRFQIGAAKRGYVAVLGRDGSGAASIYYPMRHDAQAAAFDPSSGDGLLPGAIALDATPGAETFYAVFSEQPFGLADLLPVIRDRAPLPPGMTSAEVVLQKQTP